MPRIARAVVSGLPHQKYNRTGRLWESRYHSCIVDSESYLWAVTRYIEQNPVRAKMVVTPEGYPFSSARAHFGLVKSELLSDDLFHETQRNDYIRNSLKTGRPFTSNRCLKAIEEKLAGRLAAQPIGRSRKKA